MKYFTALAVLILATTTAHAMSVMVNATGPYNYTCDDFAKAKPRERAIVLGFVQGYFAALNMDPDINPQVNLQERWRELNAFVVRYCTDKSNPYLYRRFVSDAVDEAFDEMREPKFTPAMMGTWCKENDGEEGATTYVKGNCPNKTSNLEYGRTDGRTPTTSAKPSFHKKIGATSW
jgi:hypothetical protein